MKQKHLKSSEMSGFAGQMALILQAGIPIYEGFQILKDESTSKHETKILDYLEEETASTGLLYEALEHSKIFDPYFVQMVRLGETTGNLDTVLKNLETYYQKEQEVHDTIFSSILYPLIMSAMIVVVILVLLVQVMPVFYQVYQQLGTEMNGLATQLLNFGIGYKRHALLYSSLIVLFNIFIIFLAKSVHGNKIALYIGSHTRHWKKIIRKRSIARFAESMAIATHAGFSVDQSLDLLDYVDSSKEFTKSLDVLKEDLRDLVPMDVAMKNAGFISGVKASLLAIGIRTGNVDEVLHKIADLMFDDIDVSINNRLAIIEPTLVITLSVIVGIVLLSVMLPLLNVMAAI